MNATPPAPALLEAARRDHATALHERAKTADPVRAAVAEAALSTVDDRALLAEVEKALAPVKARTRSTPRTFPSAGACVRARIGAGACVHVPTGIDTLDANTRGGLIAGRLTVIGGAPDAGKTSLAIQLGHRLARAGYVVAIHCVDEDRESIESRIGQFEGLRLEDLEAGSPETLEHLAERLEELPNLIIRDQDEDEVTVEETAKELAELARARGVVGVLIVDSLQTARTATSDDAPGLRERVNDVTGTLKAIAKRHRFLVIVTCELARGAYRSRNAKDQINDMAAFKESGAIEYAMMTGLVLRSVPGDGDLVDVTVPKNKRGKRAPFRLERDPRRCSYREVALPATTEDGKPDPAAVFGEDIGHAREVLKRNPGIAGNDEWIAKLGGKVPGKARTRAAIRHLDQAGEVENRGSRGRPRLYWWDPARGTAPPPPVSGQTRQTRQKSPEPAGGLDVQGTAEPAKPADPLSTTA